MTPSPETTSPSGADASNLEVLLRAYEVERADDTQAVALHFGLLTASLGLLSLVGFVLVRAEPDELPGWIVALAPVPPLPFAALGALLSCLSQVRGAVINRYEVELRRRSPGLSAKGLPVPSGHTVLDRIWVGSYGRIAFGLIAATLLAMYVAVLIESFRYARGTEPVLAWVSLVACSLALAVILGLYAASMFPERILRRNVV